MDTSGHVDRFGFPCMVKGHTCYVCGSANRLTRHHVVPRRVLARLPVKVRTLYHRNVVLLCKKHHKLYECAVPRSSRTETTFWVANFLSFVKRFS